MTASCDHRWGYPSGVDGPRICKLCGLPHPMTPPDARKAAADIVEAVLSLRGTRAEINERAAEILAPFFPTQPADQREAAKPDWRSLDMAAAKFYDDLFVGGRGGGFDFMVRAFKAGAAWQSAQHQATEKAELTGEEHRKIEHARLLLKRADFTTWTEAESALSAAITIIDRITRSPA